MIRALALLAALPFTAFAAPAFASDAAELNYLGFSPDGAYFAFEEYGIEDGSGSTYSNIYVIATDTDSWLPGTPIRQRIMEDEEPEKELARVQAHALAQPILAAHQIGVAGNLVVANPETEVSADPHQVAFMPLRIAPPSEHFMFGLKLEEMAMPAADCPADLYDDFTGYTLTLQAPGGKETKLHEDKQIPRSRECPIGYAISNVLTYFPETGSPVLVVIVGINQVGFEGPDRRYLAVAHRLDWNF